MREYCTLTRRELGGYFLSLTGYIIIAAAVFIMGLGFFVLLDKLQAEPTVMPITELWSPLILVIIVVTTPVITMRLFALEKFSGTYETLMTAPVTDRQVVAAKFTAGLLFYAVMWLPLIGCLLVVRHYASDPAGFDAGTIASTFLGILLVGCLAIALGCCASALTRSQVTAAVIGLVFGTSLFLVGILADHIPNQTTWQAQALAAVAFFEQMHDFARGVIDTRSIVLYLTLTLFFLFLTMRIVESRRWK
jgi:ABC-2 type transport system permease protein